MYSQNGRNNIKSVDFLKKGLHAFKFNLCKSHDIEASSSLTILFSEMSFWILRIIEFSENQVPTTHGIYK